MHIVEAFMNLLKSKESEEYIESLLACFAAPAIRGLKPANLINLRRSGDAGIAAAWSAKKEELLRKFRVNALVLSARAAEEDSSVLLMLYKKDLVSGVLFGREARAILDPLGYGGCAPRVESHLERLTERFQETFPAAFPHEIGLFLGYPPEDVEGFIRNEGKKSLTSGYWKVYGNVRRARRTFRVFEQAEHSAARAMLRRASPRASGFLL
jgi:hypothetical protein